MPLTIDKALDNPNVRAKYDGLRKKGLGHDEALFAASLGTPYNPRRDVPQILGGNTRMFTGDKLDFRQFPDEAVRKHYQKAAKEAGVDTSGAMYHPTLARYLGDPKAWVKSDDDIKDRCKERGMSFRRKGSEIEIGITPAVIQESLDGGKRKKKANKK